DCPRHCPIIFELSHCPAPYGLGHWDTGVKALLRLDICCPSVILVAEQFFIDWPTTVPGTVPLFENLERQFAEALRVSCHQPSPCMLPPRSASIFFLSRCTADLDMPVSSAMSRTLRSSSNRAFTRAKFTSSMSRIVQIETLSRTSSLASNGSASSP